MFTFLVCAVFLTITTGAVLISPINSSLLKEIQSLITTNVSEVVPHHIGIRAQNCLAPYVSLEGVQLENMPVAHMYAHLDPLKGDCLSLDGNKLDVVPCTTRLPYICYINKTDCGSGYKYYEVTNSCYKLHREQKTWGNAESICSQESGHLIVIDSFWEANLVTNMGLVSGYPYTFVGVRGYADENDTYTWKSVKGIEMQYLYNYWENYEPAEQNNCATIRNSGKLEPVSCGDYNEFICEKSHETNRRIHLPMF